MAQTTGELDLLAVFAQHPNRVLSRDQLLVLTRHREAGPFDRSIDAQVGRLRRKIESDPERPVSPTGAAPRLPSLDSMTVPARPRTRHQHRRPGFAYTIICAKID